MINYITVLLCNIFMFLVIMQFQDRVFVRKDTISRWTIIPMGMIWILGTFAISEFFHIPILNFVSSLLLTFCVTFWYKGSIIKKILNSFMILVLSAACDLATYLILKDKVSSENLYEVSYIFTVVLFWLLATIISSTLKRDKTQVSSVKELAVLFLIPISLLVVLYYLTLGGINESAIIIASFFILVCSFLMFYAYYIVIKNLDEKYKNKLLWESVMAYRNELEWIKKSQLKIEGMRHDLKNHLIELKALSDKKEYDMMSEYINSMYNDLPSSKKYSRSGLYDIDSLINYLLEEEGAALKDVSVKVLIPADIEIDRYRLNVILGNLLQNAIYAALNTEKKMLSLELKYIQGILHIELSNSYSNGINIVNGEYISTKPEEGHGLGLKNVKRLVKEQNGEIEITTTDDVFSVRVGVYL